MKWRVFSINSDGSIDLISSDATLDTLILNDAVGYNNGVYLINDLCKKHYSNSSLRSKIQVRNINIEDIENNINSGLNDLQNFNNGSITTNLCPVLYEIERVNRLGLSDDYYTSPTNEGFNDGTGEGFNIKQSGYGITQSNASNYLSDTNVLNMLFEPDEGFWISSRAIDLKDTKVEFGIRRIKNNNLLWSVMCDSLRAKGENTNNDLSLRPIIKLESSVKFLLHSGTEEDMHEIVVE